MDFIKLEKILEENNQPKFRLKQILKAIYQDGASAWSEISTLPKNLREILEKEVEILPFEIEKILESKDGQSKKTLLKLTECHPEFTCLPVGKVSGSNKKIPDQVRNDKENFIETVLLFSGKNKWTVCISCQVGCPMGCTFCATGQEGFERNLTAEEITDQILFWRQYLKKTNSKAQISNLVFMGMGEPFLNWENVKKSLKDLINPDLFGFGSRSISVSTSGIPDGMEKFQAAFPQMNLAVSLHFPDDKRRSKYMPVNKKHDMAEIKKTLKKYFSKNKRKIFIEYIMFENLNDSLQDAKKLSEYLKSVGHVYLLHVNLISYNAAPEFSSVEIKDFKASSENKTIAFRNCLKQNDINVTIRKSLGQDIQGACGQLAAH